MVCDRGTMGSLYNSEKLSARASEVKYIIVGPRQIFQSTLELKGLRTLYSLSWFGLETLNSLEEVVALVTLRS